ncbi:hypothetical protein POX_c04081 [Penicillium oxalicum]|uniref:hypothetical protein n=1 Tax=Penicillium oxalicum TaxID=69781 RepID=UPI0020B6BBB7|nr:hypothetical protein POX_c04081 [Penicillium oxalicum]KAI2791224.1 hypothetical protein POX_c04081 [Penicillium oxalicum]
MATNDPTPFQSIPWISALLQDKSFLSYTIPSRTVKTSTEDNFFSKTLNTPTTISACLSQYRLSNKPPAPGFNPSRPQAEELRIFFLLGSDLNGYPGILHGGVVAALLDEGTGLLLSFNGQVGDPVSRQASGAQTGPVTAYLHTTYLRPVPTPSAIMLQSKIVEVKEDRKWKIEARLVDGEGQVLASAEALYIRPRSKI